MKFTIFIFSYIIYLFKSLRINKELKVNSRENPFLQHYISQIKFEPDNILGDIVLHSKIYSTNLYETWDILKQESFGRRPFIAHFFKYTLGSDFPLKHDDLKKFCQKILAYNSFMEGNSKNFRAIPCYNSTAFTLSHSGANISYLLFEKPHAGYTLPNICQPNVAGDRICKYLIKNFTNGYLESVIYSQLSLDPDDVNFVLAQDGFWFARLPKVRKEKNSTNATDEVLITNQNLKKIDSLTVPPRKLFITLAYPKLSSPETFNATAQDSSTKLAQIKAKQNMVHIGKFLIEMYKGLDISTNNPPSADENFNYNMFNFKTVSDVYFYVNTGKDGKFTKFRTDDYFGVTTTLVDEARAIADKTLTLPKAVNEMNDLLKDSFYEFIFKSVMFDVDNKSQFESYQAMLQHRFLTHIPDISRTKSDTCFE